MLKPKHSASVARRNQLTTYAFENRHSPDALRWEARGSAFAGRSCSGMPSWISSLPPCGWSSRWMARIIVGAALQMRGAIGTCAGSGVRCSAVRS